MKIKIRPYNSGTVYECDCLHFEGEIVTGILRNGVNVTYNISQCEIIIECGEED